jgi:hypothetical protein
LTKEDIRELFFVVGGHGFEMLEPTEMIEVKQGPFMGDSDKTRFNPKLPRDLVYKVKP